MVAWLLLASTASDRKFLGREATTQNILLGLAWPYPKILPESLNSHQSLVRRA